VRPGIVYVLGRTPVVI